MSVNKKSNGSRAFAAILAAIISVAALIIIINLIGNPMVIGESHTSESSIAASNTKEEENANEPKETEEDQKSSENRDDTKEPEVETEEETTKESETHAWSDSETNPKNVEEAKKLEDSSDKRVYLTFDDGPSKLTGQLLDVLNKYNIKASFFNLHVTDDNLLSAQKRAYDEGHTIGIHSVTHDYDTVYVDNSSWQKDVLDEQSYIENDLGIKTYYYRFIGGSSNKIHKDKGTVNIRECVQWLDDNGFSYYDWNVSNEDSDGGKHTAQELADRVLKAIHDVDRETYMVLLHDTGAKQTTIDSLPIIIETLQKEGYTFCQITDQTKAVHHTIKD